MKESTNPKIRTNIYIDERIHAEFKKICKREGVKISSKFEAFEKHYVQAHHSGNPQLRINVYANPEEQQPMRVICIFCDGALSDGQIHCKRFGGMWVPGVKCYSCEKNLLRKHK